MGTEVWILGGTGRSARAIAAELVSRGVRRCWSGGMPLACRAAAAAGAAGSRTVVAASVEAMTAEIRRQQPAVVINTIGPVHRDGVAGRAACLGGQRLRGPGQRRGRRVALLGMNDAAAAPAAPW